MSLTFTGKDGRIIDIKKDMKILKLPDGSMAYESPSVAIPRILKKKYPKYYKEYQEQIQQRKKSLHNLHLIIKR